MANERGRFRAEAKKETFVRFPFAVLVIIGLFSPLCHSQKAPANFPPRVDAPPPILPSGCPAALAADAQMLSGSKAYLFMNRDIEALELGHMAAQQLREACLLYTSPAQKLATPNSFRARRKAWIKVTRIRVPEAPTGWPRAIAPPHTFTFSGSSLRSRMTARAVSYTHLSSSQPQCGPTYNSGRDEQTVTNR